MNFKKLNEQLEKYLINEEKEKTFADWFGQDLTGQVYEGDLNCRYQDIDSLKGCPKEVTGSFLCDGNKLQTLDGCPDRIGGHFDCGNNELTSLQDAPQYIKGSFSCANNNLTTLKGGPQKVDGDFHCYGNNLDSLEGSPKEVGGDFMCSGLSTLKGAPEKVRGCFDCEKGYLTSLEGSPKEVGGHFVCSCNNLTSLKGCPDRIGGHLVCHNNKLTSLEGAPKDMGGKIMYEHNPIYDQHKKVSKSSKKSSKISKTGQFQLGSFHDNPDTIYYNTNAKYKAAFKDIDWDNYASTAINGNLVFVQANDRSISVENSSYKNYQQFKKALNDAYEFAKNIVEKEGNIEIGAGYDEEPDVFSYFAGYVMDADEFPSTSQAFVNKLCGWLKDSSIDGDSGSLFTFVNPNNPDQFYEFDPEEFGIDTDEDDEY